MIVSNPPIPSSGRGDDNPILINDPRFSPAGVLAPKSKGDLAFIMHDLSWLAVCTGPPDCVFHEDDVRVRMCHAAPGFEHHSETVHADAENGHVMERFSCG